MVSCFLFLAGIFMKTMHWPGAGVVITASIALFALVYSVLLMLDKNRAAQTSFQKTVNLLGLVTMIIVSSSFLFKAMHWPGAGILIYIAHGILILMIPVMFIRGTKESDPVAKMRIYNTAILFTFIIGVSIYIWWRTSLA